MTASPSAAGCGRITLLTDFGTADGYVAAMRGVIATLAPSATVEDAAHDIPPGDIAAAAWTLARYWQLYPPGTVHVVVVDPGVGSERRALAAGVLDRFIVAPDNGCASVALAMPDARSYAIRNPALLREPVSRTFHGRDVFAPVAAHLAAGMPLETVGPPIADPVILPSPAPWRGPGTVHGVVVHVDRFGNLITNLPGGWALEIGEIEVDGRTVAPVRDTYASVSAGQAVALVGSAGFIEISIRDGSAARELPAVRGATVRGSLR